MINLSLSQVQKLQSLWPWVCRKPASDARGSVLCPTGGGGGAGRAAGGPAPPDGGGANQESDEQNGQWERVRKTTVTEEPRDHGGFLFSIDGTFQKISIQTSNKTQETNSKNSKNTIPTTDT